MYSIIYLCTLVCTCVVHTSVCVCVFVYVRVCVLVWGSVFINASSSQHLLGSSFRVSWLKLITVLEFYDLEHRVSFDGIVPRLFPCRGVAPLSG